MSKKNDYRVSFFGFGSSWGCGDYFTGYHEAVQYAKTYCEKANKNKKECEKIEYLVQKIEW